MSMVDIIAEIDSLILEESRTCGAKCVVYSRVCGFYTPTNNWNLGKKEEFKMRKTFKLEKEDESTK